MAIAGALLRDARQAAGLTQTELARRLGISQPAVARLESRAANPSIETLDRALRGTGHRLQLIAPAWSDGVDETMIRRDLELTPGQRIGRLERMYAEARKLAVAGARARGELA